MRLTKSSSFSAAWERQGVKNSNPPEFPRKMITRVTGTVKLHFAHRFDSVKQMQKVFLKLLRHSTNSDACLAKKTDQKFRWEVTTKRCAKFENAPWYQMDGMVLNNKYTKIPPFTL